MTYIAEGARIIGDVTFKEDCSVWYNAVIRGDDHPVRIGNRVNIQDGCVFHASRSADLIVGDDVTIGHGALIHGCTIGNSCIIGMGAILMNDAVIPDFCIVGAGALVTEGKTFPSGSLILGSPAKAVRALREEERQSIRASALFYVNAAKEQLSMR